MTSTHQPKVLHVDDSPTARRHVGRALREAGYEVVEAASTREALALAVDNPDMIVLDVNMPDMSGFEAWRRLKSIL